MNRKVRTIIVDGTEIMTSLTAVEIADRLRTYDDLKEENERLNNIINELEKYTKSNIEVCENRLSTPFCNFEKVTKELMIYNNYLDKLKELKELKGE